MIALLFSMQLTGPAFAQIEPIDPDEVIGTDNSGPPPAEGNTTVNGNSGVEPVFSSADAPIDAPIDDGVPTDGLPQDSSYPTVDTASGATTIPTPTANSDDKTYQQDDLIGAAEGVFGKGAKGLAGLIEDILKKQGQPNGYIVGREGGGAFVVGLRYGSGTLFHKVEGERPVYWTGPSIGFDAGANAGSTFVLVYNLYDTEDLYKRFASAEGVAYLVGGFNASYMRKGDVVLIPIRVGAGLRLGANVGYMKMSKKQNWIPF